MKLLSRIALVAACMTGAAYAQNIDQAVSTTKADVDKALNELSTLRSQIAEEQVPLTRQINQLQDDVVKQRREAERIQRRRDNRQFDLNALRTEVKQREDEVVYLSNLLNEYIRAFDSRLHLAERQIYGESINAGSGAYEDASLSRAQKFEKQIDTVETALTRLENVIGGHAFTGTAILPSGVESDGRYTIVGPVACFAASNGSDAGLALVEQNRPNAVLFPIKGMDNDFREFALNARGLMPFDPSGGDAIKYEGVRETIVEHFLSGGPVMWPILALAVSAILVALYKWFQLSAIKTSKASDLQKILDTLNHGDKAAALQTAQSVPAGPFRELLVAAVEHSNESKEMIEEILYERMLHTQPKLESMLPFIALAASASPLLGLLGTVTGMINTFKLITVFGTGDAKALSSGIAEALITTEYGLYIAIPTLLTHAALYRKAKGVINHMEQTTVAFLNGISRKS